jgi:GT2 family glycosyltransferase
VENNSNEQDVFAYYKKIDGHNNIRVLYYPEEFNYSKINNWAVKQAKGKYVVLMNNDVTIISPDWMEEMLMYAQRSDVGAVGAKLLYPDSTVQHGGIIVGAGVVAHHAYLGLAANNPGYAGRAVLVQNWSAVTAALMMLPKKVFEQINGFDENIAVAYNDVDLCLRLRQADYLIVCNPDVLGHHYESKSRGYDNTVIKRKRAEEEIECFYKKWGKDLHDPYYNINLEELCSIPFRM